MKKQILITVSALALAAGCFKDQGSPRELPTANSLEELASASNRAEIARVLLRGGKGEIAPDAFANMPSLSVLDLAERGLKSVPDAVKGLDKLESLYLSIHYSVECLYLTSDGILHRSYISCDIV